MSTEMQNQILRASLTDAELKLWNHLANGNLKVVPKLYDLNAMVLFAFILAKVRSREKSICIMLASFYTMLEKQKLKQLSGIELNQFLFNTVVDYTINFNTLMFKIHQERVSKGALEYSKFFKS